MDHFQLFKIRRIKKIKKCYRSALTAILRPAVDSVGCPESESMFGFPGRGLVRMHDVFIYSIIDITFSIMYNLIKPNKNSPTKILTTKLILSRDPYEIYRYFMYHSILRKMLYRLVCTSIVLWWICVSTNWLMIISSSSKYLRDFRLNLSILRLIQFISP